ncbi:MAG: 2-oxo acid dehydrogenase subunit E2 [Fimbriimonadaceae bacterium]|nr:2-oxo acid dehydrogenase subunit E2 [Fimbriimonadaceae bacterium]
MPQIGEGLEEARIVALLKQPGDSVRRDEPIYQMETDKAVMDVESSADGIVVEWKVKVDDVVPIGAPVVVVRSAGSEPVTPTAHRPEPAAPAASVSGPAAASSAGRRRDLPPRTRAYARDRGLTEDDLAALPDLGRNLLPADVDAWMESRTAAPVGQGFSDAPLPQRQRILSSRLVRGTKLVVPGMMNVTADWSGIESARAAQAATGSDNRPSAFTYFAFAVAQAAKNHPIFRSTLVGEDTVRTFDHLHLGVAVSLPDDELVVAVVHEADTLDWWTFAARLRDAIQRARNGEDQADQRVTLSLTNMAGHGIREAMAVVVPPAVATLFLGETYWGFADPDSEGPKPTRCTNIGITIDHRIVNGVGGALFLNEIRDNVQRIRELVNR